MLIVTFVVVWRLDLTFLFIFFLRLGGVSKKKRKDAVCVVAVCKAARSAAILVSLLREAVCAGEGRPVSRHF